MSPLSILFWASAVGFLTPIGIYPMLIYLLSRFAVERQPGKATPTATIVISAFNECRLIDQKVRNAMASDYPADRLDIMVISDASDDGSDEIVLGINDSRVQLCRMPQRVGKSAGLSRFCPQAKGDILVFTDANSMFQPDALAHLLCHFDDPQVGYTVGQQQYVDTEQAASSHSENMYWSMELLLKQWESRLSSVVGADGAIYALRKEHFSPLTAQDINDFLLPLRVIAKGYVGVFDFRAVCFEKAAPNFAGEFRRKKRIVNRSLRALFQVPATLNPFRVGWFAFQLVCHKLLRWMCPVFMIVLLATSTALAIAELRRGAPGIFSVALICQVMAYALAAMYCIRPLKKFRLVYLCYYFLTVNVASAMGMMMLVRGQVIGTWKPER